MTLVAIVMALLLTGTLKGLFTFRAMMRTFDGKLPELEKAETLKGRIQFLAHRPDGSGQLLAELYERLHQARAALEEYRLQLEETVQQGRDPEQGYREKGMVRAIAERFDRLEKALNDAKIPTIIRPGMRTEAADILGEGHPVRNEIDALRSAASDLVNILNGEMSQRVGAMR